MGWFGRGDVSEPVAAPALHLNRRGFLGGLLAALTVPAIIKVDSLVAVTPELITPELVVPDHLWMARFDIYQHMFTVSSFPRPPDLTDLAGQSFRALPEELCASLDNRFGHLRRTDAELELTLTEEQMMLPRFGSLVPQRTSMWGNRTAGADLDRALSIQHAIDGATAVPPEPQHPPFFDEVEKCIITDEQRRRAEAIRVAAVEREKRRVVDDELRRKFFGGKVNVGA